MAFSDSEVIEKYVPDNIHLSSTLNTHCTYTAYRSFPTPGAYVIRYSYYLWFQPHSQTTRLLILQLASIISSYPGSFPFPTEGKRKWIPAQNYLCSFNEIGLWLQLVSSQDHMQPIMTPFQCVEMLVELQNPWQLYVVHVQ